jgi:hypothetical protein
LHFGADLNLTARQKSGRPGHAKVDQRLQRQIGTAAGCLDHVDVQRHGEPGYQLSVCPLPFAGLD